MRELSQPEKIMIGVISTGHPSMPQLRNLMNFLHGWEDGKADRTMQILVDLGALGIDINLNIYRKI